MLIEDVYSTFLASMTDLWFKVIGFLPVMVGAFVVFVLGWVVAVGLGRLVVRVLKAMQVDKLFDQLGVMQYVKKAGFDWDVSTFVGGLVRWFFVIVTFLATVEILGLSQLSQFINDILLYIPNVVVAALILLVAAVVAHFLEKLVKASIHATELGPAHLVGTVVRWGVWGFAILAAMSQLGIARALVEILFTGLVAMLAIAGGLAFGLGGKDAAREVLEGVRKDVSVRRHE